MRKGAAGGFAAPRVAPAGEERGQHIGGGRGILKPRLIPISTPISASTSINLVAT